MAENLVKLAVIKEIEKLTEKALMINMSVKYQVLCNHTAMIGIVKQEKAATEEMEEVSIKFGTVKYIAAAIPSKPAPI